MTLSFRTAAMAMGLLLALPGAQASRLRYSCELLHHGSDDAYGGAINDAGGAVGFNAGATRWSPKGKRAALEGVIVGQAAEVLGINGAGRVVGYSGIYGFPGVPTVWDADVPAALPMLPGGTKGLAYALNDNDTIVGATTFDGGDWMHAAAWDGGAVTDLGTLGKPEAQARRQSMAVGLNRAGEVVGHSDADDEGHDHAVYWGADRQIVDLGALPGGADSGARSINEAGVIVGSSGFGGGAPDSRWPVVWRDKAIHRLSLPAGQNNGWASGINASNHIVGGSGTPVVVNGVSFVGTAYVWLGPDAAAVDLNTVSGPCEIKHRVFAGQRLVWAVDINADGVILAELQGVPYQLGWYFRAARLTPVR